MNLKEYVEKTELSSGKGLPQGDTFIDLDSTDVQEEDFDGRLTFKLKLVSGEEYFVPKSVMAQIKEEVANGLNRVRVTRKGKTKEDTRYTVVGIKTEKVVKE